MAWKSVFELEEDIREEYAKDKSSGEFYLAVKRLAERVLVKKDMARDRPEIDEISHELATYIYELVNIQGREIRMWLKYIMVSLKGIRADYLKMKKPLGLNIDDVVSAEILSNNLIPKGQTDRERRYLELEDLLKDISEEALEIFDNYVRYKKGTELYRRLKLSVMYTISDYILYNRGRVVVVGLNYNEYRLYVKFLMNTIFKRLGVKFKYLLGGDLSRSTESLELLGAKNEYYS